MTIIREGRASCWMRPSVGERANSGASSGAARHLLPWGEGRSHRVPGYGRAFRPACRTHVLEEAGIRHACEVPPVSKSQAASRFARERRGGSPRRCMQSARERRGRGERDSLGSPGISGFVWRQASTGRAGGCAALIHPTTTSDALPVSKSGTGVRVG